MKEFFKDKNLKSHPIINIIELLVMLLALWFVMSGIFTTKFIIFGVTSCIIICLICCRVMVVGGLKSESTYFVLNVNYIKFFIYFLWLLKEIVKAAIYVSKVSLFKTKNVNPQVVWFKADYDNPVAAALLANSITLTPGTITVDILDNGIFSVHALDDELAEGVLSGDMQVRVAKVYGETITFEKLEAKSIKDKIEYAKKAANDKKASSTSKKPSTSNKSSADKNSSNSKKPPTSNKASTSVKPSANKKSSTSKKPSANKKSSTGKKPAASRNNNSRKSSASKNTANKNTANMRKEMK